MKFTINFSLPSFLTYFAIIQLTIYILKYFKTRNIIQIPIKTSIKINVHLAFTIGMVYADCAFLYACVQQYV